MNVSLFLEIKQEYTEHVLDILASHIQEGLTSIYNRAYDDSTRAENEEKTLIIFQKYLMAIEEWPQSRINDETTRIRVNSNTVSYFDDLIKALVKTHIILLTYSNNISNIIAETFYNNFSVSSFVHKSYTECAKDAYNNPFLFYHDVAPLDVKRNNIIINNNIRDGIVRAVRKSLPISSILKEFLVNSVNIIPEPPKVELLGLNKNNENNITGVTAVPVVLPTVPMHSMPMNALPPAQIEKFNNVGNSNKIDPQLEREVLQIIQSDHNQTEKDKIRKIMNMDQFISTIDKGRHIKTDNDFKLNDSENRNANPLNANLDASERRVININIGKSPAKAPTRNPSETSLPTRPPIHKRAHGDDVSDRPDPSKIRPIENYGMPVNNRTKRG